MATATAPKFFSKPPAPRHLRVARRAIGGVARKRSVPHIQRGVWKAKRIAKLTENVRFAGAAKAYRSALNVTQEQMGNWFNVTSQAVTHWESGCYFGWSAEDLSEYCRVCDKLGAAR